MKINSVKGMKDVLPVAEGEDVAFNSRLWEKAERVFRDVPKAVAFYRDGQNDEALMLEENLPGVLHLQGADRVELAKIVVERSRSEVLILDDGFQHRRLQRHLDIVLIDAPNPLNLVFDLRLGQA